MKKLKFSSLFPIILVFNFFGCDSSVDPSVIGKFFITTTEVDQSGINKGFIGPPFSIVEKGEDCILSIHYEDGWSLDSLVVNGQIVKVSSDIKEFKLSGIDSHKEVLYSFKRKHDTIIWPFVEKILSPKMWIRSSMISFDGKLKVWNRCDRNSGLIPDTLIFCENGSYLNKRNGEKIVQNYWKFSKSGDKLIFISLNPKTGVKFMEEDVDILSDTIFKVGTDGIYYNFYVPVK